jgi:hypothetical protein
MFSPVYGRVPLEAGVVLGADVVDGEEVAVAPLEDCDELEEGAVDVVDPLGEEEPDGLDPVCVPDNGSTYCWSPAEVLVPEATALAVTNSATIASATQQTRIRDGRRTMGVFKQ